MDMNERLAPLSTGIQMEYVEQGRTGGVPVVFLQGVTDSWRSFERVLPLLPSWMHAYAISARGHGNSSKPERGYLLSDMSADLAAFLDAMSLGRPILVGHSMGSMVAQRFVTDHPDRCAGLVLVGTFATLFQDPGVTAFYQSAIAPLVDPIEERFAREWQQSTLARPMPADHLDTVVAETLKVPARVWHEAFEGFLTTPDFSRELARVSVPSLIVWGNQDTYALRDGQDRLAALIPGVRFIEYAGAGHALHWEDPARFTADLTAFITAAAGVAE